MALHVHVPFKLLEINIISAQDLPPVSKMLRTFAVAYINPDHKLTTRVDHQGHTNPTWNYKVVFNVDEKFLKQESAAITIEIYNVAWLRDLPIGTTRLLINNISPPLHNSAFRRVALQICRPSGHLQGTLNLGVQLVDNNIPDCEMAIPPPMIINNEQKTELEEEDDDKTEQDQNRGSNDYFKEELDSIELEKINSTPQITQTDEFPISLSPTESTILTDRPETKSVVASNTSLFSPVRPLPSEVAKEMKKGVYSAEWNEYGSSVFDSWTETEDKSENLSLKSKSVEWPTEEQIPLRISTHDDQEKTGTHKKRRSDNSSSKKSGLFSCFGNAYGFQFSFICGSKAMKKKKKKRNVIIKQDFQLVNVPQENLRRFHV